MRGGYRHQLLRSEAEGIESAAVRRPAFGKRHVFGDPDQAKRWGGTLRHRQGKPDRRREMRLANCRDFVERAEDEAAIEHRIDGGDAEGQSAGAALDPWPPLQGLQTLAELVDHP